MVRKISLVNQKGGVAKTTSTINIGAGLQRLGYKILLVDLDSQANLTYSLGIKAHELERTIYDVLKGEAQFQDVVISNNQLDVLPSSLDLSGAEIELSGIAGREFLLKEILDSLVQYDYILMDCPPSLGLLTLNSLVASNEVFVPVQTEYLALQGTSKLIQTIEVIKKRLNSDLAITGVIATRFDKRKSLNKEVMQTIKSHFGDKLFETAIRDNVSLAEAPSYAQDIFSYKADSKGAEDYLDLCKEIQKQEVKLKNPNNLDKKAVAK